MLLHIYSDDSGESRFGEWELGADLEQLPVDTMMVVHCQPGVHDFHNVPAVSFAVNLTGELEVTTSLGEKRRMGPGQLVFIEDTTGKGHFTEHLTDVTTLILRVPENFELSSWARVKTQD